MSIVAESLAIQGADSAAIDGLLAKWQQLHPDYADILFADQAGRVRATARGRIVGSDLSGSPWFAKALVGGIVGEAADQGGSVQYLVQGTLYPDVVESGGGTGTANIKSLHNGGGLPEDLEFELVEPLRTLFKDEVRLVGEQLGQRIKKR